MCPLCITAGTAYLVGVGTGSAGGLAAIAARVLGRRGQKIRPDRSPGPASSHARANIECQETIDAVVGP
jgi:hypothetical protein